MKIAIYIYYFFRSVFLRGLFKSLSLLRAEPIYEKRFGIKTAKIKRSTSLEFFHYQGASYQQLLRIFTEIFPLTKEFEFVDIGSGKGRAVFVAESIGYKHLTGIELDDSLHKEAVDNLEIYPLKKSGSTINFLHANALEHAYKNTPTLYFLFNPFNEEVLKKVIHKIKTESFSETWFVYMNPLYPKPFEEAGMELVKKFKTRFYLEANVYRMNTKKENYINS